jgi:glycosyltransferase involved in cell wall biosynthesis
MQTSFIIPAHNEQHTLPGTLTAIRDAAAACALIYEIIVVDDASCDDTARLAQQHGARVVPVAHRQIAATRNAGARAAGGDLYIFVDADTRIDAAVVHATLAALHGGAVGGGAGMRFDEPAPRYARWVLAAVVALFRRVGWASGCYVFCTRAAFAASDGFDERFYASEEIAFSRALKRQGRFVVLREPVETSARKVRIHSPGEIARLLIALVLAGPAGLRRREKLAFWYTRRRDPRDGET